MRGWSDSPSARRVRTSESARSMRARAGSPTLPHIQYIALSWGGRVDEHADEKVDATDG